MLEVIWNGAVNSPSKGLLCVPVDPPPAPEISRDRWRRDTSHDARFRQVVALITGERWWTMPQIMQATGLTVGKVQVALQRCRRSGRLERQEFTGVQRTRSGWIGYRLRAQEAA